MKEISDKRVLILSHLWPGNPQSTNPQSGIYVYDQIAEISKIIKSNVIVPLSIIPRMKEIINFRGSLIRTIKNRISYKPDKAESLKYLSLMGKHFDSVFISFALLIRKNKEYDIIHCHTMFPDGLAGMIVSFITGKPFIVTIHGSEIMFIDSHPADKVLAKMILQRAKSVISVSELMKEKILNITDGKSNISVIHNGIREMFPMLEKKKVIFFAGKLTEVKDPEMLLDAFEIFSTKEKNYKLVIAGDGKLRKKLEVKINKKHLFEKVLLLGYIDRERIKENFSKAFLLAITSRSEGFPTVIYESFSSGTPIVSFNVGGVKEAVRDGENGFIVKIRNAESFAEYLNKAVNTNWNREIIRKEAENFLWEKLSKKIVELYK